MTLTEKQKFILSVFESFESELNKQGISDETQVRELFLEALRDIRNTPREQLVSELTEKKRDSDL